MNVTLKCHTSKDPFFTKEKEYEVVLDTDNMYRIITDDEEEHSLTKTPDYMGRSYKDFMSINQ